jgi:hypothetical protein
MKLFFIYLSFLLWTVGCSSTKESKVIIPASKKLRYIKISNKDKAVRLYRLMREDPENYNLYKKELIKLFTKRRKYKKRLKRPISNNYEVNANSEESSIAIKQSNLPRIIRESEQRMSFYCFSDKVVARHGGEDGCKRYIKELRERCLKKEEYSIINRISFSYLFCIKKSLI